MTWYPAPGFVIVANCATVVRPVAGAETRIQRQLPRRSLSMSTDRYLLLGLAIATAGLFFFAGSVSAGGQLIVVERATSDTVTDIGAKGDSAGDVLTFANEVYDETNKTLVGHDNGWGKRNVGGRRWGCFSTPPLHKE